MHKKITLADTGEVVGTGWLPPLPDLRDYTDEHLMIAPIVKQLAPHPAKRIKGLPSNVDLRADFPRVENQGSINSCSAHAAMGLVEYSERRSSGKYIGGSRLFVYKTARDLMGVVGDTGAYLRDSMGAIVMFGLPPEKYWPYNVVDFDKEPPTFVYMMASHSEALKYFAHDAVAARRTQPEVLASVKKYLAAGVPSMFGFSGFTSWDQTKVKGAFAFPCPNEKSSWGHSVVAVGYDDRLKIKNLKCKKETTGALLIRNSWGASWGDHGYGWIPYEYVLNKYASDFWSLLSMKWIDTKQFGL